MRVNVKDFSYSIKVTLKDNCLKTNNKNVDLSFIDSRCSHGFFCT